MVWFAFCDRYLFRFLSPSMAIAEDGMRCHLNWHKAEGKKKNNPLIAPYKKIRLYLIISIILCQPLVSWCVLTSNVTRDEGTRSAGPRIVSSWAWESGRSRSALPWERIRGTLSGRRQRAKRIRLTWGRWTGEEFCSDTWSLTTSTNCIQPLSLSLFLG